MSRCSECRLTRATHVLHQYPSEDAVNDVTADVEAMGGDDADSVLGSMFPSRDVCQSCGLSFGLQLVEDGHEYTMTPLPTGCRCSQCGAVHSEFIEQFGRWPERTHQESMELRRRRLDNEASWDRAFRLTTGEGR